MIARCVPQILLHFIFCELFIELSIMSVLLLYVLNQNLRELLFELGFQLIAVHIESIVN